MRALEFLTPAGALECMASTWALECPASASALEFLALAWASKSGLVYMLDLFHQEAPMRKNRSPSISRFVSALHEDL